MPTQEISVDMCTPNQMDRRKSFKAQTDTKKSKKAGHTTQQSMAQRSPTQHIPKPHISKPVQSS